MNDDHTELENDLRRLTPRAPSLELEERIARSLNFGAPEPEPSSWWRTIGFNNPLAALSWGLAIPGAVAATLAAIAFLRPAYTAPSSSGPTLNASVTASANAPVQPYLRSMQNVKLEDAGYRNVVYDAVDEGVVRTDDNELARKTRYRSADRVAWRDPKTGVDWEITYPREDVVLTPVRVE